MRLNYQLRKWIMEKVEQYIQEHTRDCNNQYDLPEYFENGIKRLKEYKPWLTPEHARKVAQIAREETIKEVCEWIEENIGEYCDGENIMFSAIHIESIDVFAQERFIDDLKKYLEGKA